MENFKEKKKPLIILTGPTAVGKTALSIGLAKAVGGEIISADSMQVYKGMDIGTAKITPEEMDGVPHYLVDELEPWEEFNVVVFQKLCKKYMEQIYAKGKIPIIVGGTGFYIQSVLYDIDFTENEADTSYRQMLEQKAEEVGAEALHQELAKTDPESAEQIHPNNVKKVIRALEYYHQTGEKISEHNETQRQKKSPYDFIYYVLSLPREILYDRINKRVELMRQGGLEEEVRRLEEHGCTRGLVSMQGLGYKEILDAFAGKCTMDEAFDKIKLETRHFAKRQFTWFRRERTVTWLDKEQYDSEDALLAHCVEEIRERFLL
jgi:tRNA dimethylallyltransferase